MRNEWGKPSKENARSPRAELSGTFNGVTKNPTNRTSPMGVGVNTWRCALIISLRYWKRLRVCLGHAIRKKKKKENMQRIFKNSVKTVQNKQSPGLMARKINFLWTSSSHSTAGHMNMTFLLSRSWGWLNTVVCEWHSAHSKYYKKYGYWQPCFLLSNMDMIL